MSRILPRTAGYFSSPAYLQASWLKALGKPSHVGFGGRRDSYSQEVYHHATNSRCVTRRQALNANQAKSCKALASG
ncbi:MULTISPECIES: hypothetical protein [unclassified Coleofasciculus]|uniref:hypothetical protein n=1 Tax=unclassified Coleofasciculus TaxID=2692782 RepID=UPI001D151EC8|nr:MULTISPECIES: hypothetical protein [unclassified Coleofasciculus]